MTSAAIPAEIFDLSHVRRWCLQEGEYLTVSRQDYQPFHVDQEALWELRQSPRIWHIDFNRGLLEDDDFHVFETLPELESLGFDCGWAPLPAPLKDLKNLTELTLSRPVVDDDFFEMLVQLPKLESLTLTQPEFEGNTAVTRKDRSEFASLRLVNVNYARLNQPALKTIGQFPAQVHLTDCHLIQKGTAPIEMPRTKSLMIQTCVLRDADLAIIEAVPELRRFGLFHTNVTESGLEDISQRFPHLAIQIE